MGDRKGIRHTFCPGLARTSLKDYFCWGSREGFELRPTVPWGRSRGREGSAEVPASRDVRSGRTSAELPECLRGHGPCADLGPLLGRWVGVDRLSEV